MGARAAPQREHTSEPARGFSPSPVAPPASFPGGNLPGSRGQRSGVWGTSWPTHSRQTRLPTLSYGATESALGAGALETRLLRCGQRNSAGDPSLRNSPGFAIAHGARAALGAPGGAGGRGVLSLSDAPQTRAVQGFEAHARARNVRRWARATPSSRGTRRRQLATFLVLRNRRAGGGKNRQFPRKACRPLSPFLLLRLRKVRLGSGLRITSL